MWIPGSSTFILIALLFMGTVQATDNELIQPLRSLSPGNRERFYLSKDPLRNGQEKWPFVECGLMYNVGDDQIYCTVQLASVANAYNRTGCPYFTYIRNGGEKFWDSGVPFQVGALFSPDKLIVSWEEPNQKDGITRKIFLWDDPPYCQKKSFELSYTLEANKPSSQSHMIFYNDTFDVVIADKSKCGMEGKCRLTYNNVGDLVKVGPAFPLDVTVDSIRTVGALSPKEGFFAVGYSDAPNGNLEARFVSESGVMRRFDTDLTTNAVLSKVPVSTAYGLVSLCGLNYVSRQAENATVINCRQFDLNTASPKLNVTFEYPKYINAMALYNVPNGGFLSAALQCGKRPQEGNCTLIVDKIQSDGQKSELYTSGLGSNCDEIGRDLVFEIAYQGESEFCFYVICTSNEYFIPEEQIRLSNYGRECVTLDHVFEY